MPTTSEFGEQFLGLQSELESMDRLKQIHTELIPKFGPSWNQQALVTMRRQTLSRILYLDWIYQHVTGKPGVICEFGVRWGSVSAILMGLRSIYEPFNHQRKLFFFDTFEGFSSIDKNDPKDAKAGDYAVDEGHYETFQEIMALLEQQSPLEHIRKHKTYRGDASQTILQWLEDNPGVAIGLAVFDMDVYRPTRDVLEAIKPRLFKGSVLVFDEFSCVTWPGETIALDEVFGLNNLEMKHHPHQPNCSMFVY